jgi:methyltransferase (TIGR00027 family)
MTSSIKDVSDTAFWVAYHRQLETERSDALFSDPFAARLAGERGRRISETVPTSNVVAWTVALRTVIIDEFLAGALKSGIDTVLNLGAGLDARPYRLELPAMLHWVEADYPSVLEYKESLLRDERPSCHLERIGIDLSNPSARQDLFTRVGAGSGGTLVLTEGVVPYLSNEDVAALADDLRTITPFRLWIMDYFSDGALRYRQRAPVRRAMANAPFKFRPGDWLEFFKQRGWKARDIRYFPDEAERLGRPFPLLGARLMVALGRRLLPREQWDALRRFAGYVMLDSTKSSP